MAFSGPLHDRQMIRERMSAYADAIFSRDREAWLACWTEDGVWTVAGSTFEGKEALYAQWEDLWASLKKMTFFTEVGAIEVRGDEATARCYCREILLLNDGSLRKIVGVYNDQLRSTAEGWLFTRRDYALFLDESRS